MKIKRIIIFLFIMLSILNINKIVYAYDQNTADDAGQLITRGRDFITLGENDSTIDLDQAYGGFEEIAGLLLGIGIFVAVGVGMIIGIKFLISSPQGRAEYKQLLSPFIIGTALVVGALAIWRIAIQILDH